MMKLNVIDWVALILLVVGGLNWGATAFKMNVVDAIFGMGSGIAMIIYCLVGVAALYVIIFTFRKCMMMGKSMM